MIVEKEEDKSLLHFEECIESVSVRFVTNKRGERYAFLDDLIKLVDENKDFDEFLSTDRGLDFLIDWKKRHPDKPFYKTMVSGQQTYLVEV